MAASRDSTKTVCFDLDGTLCTNTNGAYDRAEPFPWAIERLNRLADAGHRIIVFTARGTATGIDWRETTEAQLERWGVRYDDLRLGKPSADVYVDDRAVHTTAWRGDDRLAVPGFALPVAAGQDEELPGVPVPQRTTVVESGRTYAGRPFLLDEHVMHAVALARAAGIRMTPSEDELAAAVESAISGQPEDVVFSIVLAEPATRPSSTSRRRHRRPRSPCGSWPRPPRAWRRCLRTPAMGRRSPACPSTVSEGAWPPTWAGGWR